MQAPHPSVLILTPPDGNFEASLALMDAVRAAGIERVTLEARVAPRTK
jgi:hypothetical protein